MLPKSVACFPNPCMLPKSLPCMKFPICFCMYCISLYCSTVAVALNIIRRLNKTHKMAQYKLFRLIRMSTSVVVSLLQECTVPIEKSSFTGI